MGALALLVLMFGIGFVQPEPEYMFTFPSNLEAGQETSFCFSASYTSEEEWQLGDSYEVVANITLTMPDEDGGILQRFEYISDIARIKNDGQLVNVALKKNTKQYEGQHHIYDSSRAVDGNTNQRMYDNSCTHTKAYSRYSPYWEVDLGDVYSIKYIRIYNRQDCCGTRLRQVKISTSKDHSNFTTFAYHRDAFGKVENIYPNDNFTFGQWVKIALEYRGMLSLCEVEVMARSPMAKEFSNCPSIRAPEIPGEYKVDVTASILYAGRVRDIFKAQNKIRVHRPKLITLIQTDKPVYTPGQTVKFRVMMMDHQLMGKDFGYAVISIKGPDGNIAADWTNVKTQNGLVSLEMLLIEEPILGVWKIIAVSEEGEEEAIFKVQEYVEPKFEVTITPPTYLLPTTPAITGKVCAKYGHGQPVKGTMNLTICLHSDDGVNERPCASNKIEKFEACHKFSVKATKIKLDKAKYLHEDTLKISVTVVDKNNGLVQEGVSTGPTLTRSVLNMKFEDDSSNYYKSAFPYSGRLIITHPDGMPAAGENVTIIAESFYDEKIWPPYTGPTQVQLKRKGLLKSDVNGVVKFMIRDLPSSAGFLMLKAFHTGSENDARFRFDSDGGTLITTNRPQATLEVRKWYSASNSYIYIPNVDQVVKCGSQLDLDVFYTSPVDTTNKFQAMVKSGDRIVSTQAHEETFVQDSSVIIDIMINLGQTLDSPVPDNAETPKVKRSAEGASLMENLEMNDQPTLKGAVQLTGHFLLPINVTYDMSPIATVIVYYIRDDGEIVTSSVKFEIEPCFKNKVEMDFQEKELLPSSKAVFTLRASPSSTCYVGMVDKRVNLYGGQNWITPAQVYQKVREVSKIHRSQEEDSDYCSRAYPEFSGSYRTICEVNSDCKYELGFVCIQHRCECETSSVYIPSLDRCKKICRGSTEGIVKHGTKEARYEMYKQRYTNCSFVESSLEITGLQGNFDLGFLKDIEEVNGYVLIVNVYSYYLNLTNLRIIRGKRLYQGASLYLGSNHNPLQDTQGLLELQFNSLSEITNGKVMILYNNLLCLDNTIEWKDIINPNQRITQVKAYSRYIRDCDKKKVVCRKECFNEDTQRYHCWGSGPNMCQKLSYVKDVCHKNCAGRCFGSGENQCCHTECAAGCTGPKNTHCMACRHFMNDGECVLKCPPLNDTNGRYTFETLCVKDCPSYMFKSDGACVLKCPKNKKPPKGSNDCDWKKPRPSPYENDYSYILADFTVDASKSFKDFDLWVETGAVLETRRCRKEQRFYNNMSTPVPTVGGMQEMVDEKSVQKSNIISSIFPETWLWDTYTVGELGESNVTETIPSIPTDWIGNSICTHVVDGVGVSEMTTITGLYRRDE